MNNGLKAGKRYTIWIATITFEGLFKGFENDFVMLDDGSPHLIVIPWRAVLAWQEAPRDLEDLKS